MKTPERDPVERVNTVSFDEGMRRHNAMFPKPNLPKTRGVLSAISGVASATFGLVVMVPLALLLHLPLRAFGRCGTVRRTGSHLAVKVDGTAFRRVARG